MKLAQKTTINYFRAKFNILSLVSTRKAAKSAFKLFCTPFRPRNKKTPAIFSKAEKLKFNLNHLTIKGYRWNTGGEKKVLIAHGFESNCKNFERYINPFIKKNYEVLAFDAPAHGESDGKRITLPLYVETLSAIYDQYGPIESFIAHSFGGLALAHFLELTPHNEACKTVFIAPATETTSALDSFCRFLQIDATLRKEIDQLIVEKNGEHPSHYSIPRALQQIKASILWVHDEDDDVTPLKDVTPVIKKKLPNVQFMITQGLGHRKIYRDNKVTKSIIDFL
jgi:pimeloyl-ACP methyl ester carboxylesterase